MLRITTSLRFMLAAAMLLLASISRSAAQDYYSGSASYQQFYDELAPYGEWINDPQYGYVWVPDAGSDFRPYYTNGYWVNSDYGNTWVSDYEWGWAPFHYGRWTYSSFYGWVWIPGSEWGPAWVSWRSGAGCYGWAPLGPGVSVNLSFGGGYYVPDYWWTFTPCQHILDRDFHNYSYGPRYNTNYIHQTSILHNTYVQNHTTYIAGPRRNELEAAIGHQVRPVAINNFDRPNRSQVIGDRLQMYRPAISENRPASVERPRSFRPAETPLPTNSRDAANEANRNRPVFNRSQMSPQDRPAQGQNYNAPAINGNNINRPNVQQPSRPVMPASPNQNPQIQPGRNELNPNSGRPFRQPRQQQVDMRGQQQQIDQQRAQQEQMRQQQDVMNQQRMQQMQQRSQQQQQMQQQRMQMQQQRAQPPQMNQQRMQQMQQQRAPLQQPRQQPPSAPVREQPAQEGGGEHHRGR